MILFRPRKPRREDTSDGVDVIGARSSPLSDLYHVLLRAPWSAFIGLLCAVFLLANLLFAIAYAIFGGVVGARPGSLLDAFFFSVQTMGTIGYGAMYPQSMLAQTLVTMQSLVSIFLVALTTGIVFAKFSVPRARIQFAAAAVIAPWNGVATLMFRLGNERSSRIIEATVRVVMMRTEVTVEGVTFYRMHDLLLERERSPALSRSWTVMHRITPGSPLFGATPESLKRDEIEFILTVVGVDDASAQNLHGGTTYAHDRIRWGSRHADLLTERPDGILQLDIRRFHDLVTTEPTPDFPYPEV